VTLVTLVTMNRGPFRSRRAGRRDAGLRARFAIAGRPPIVDRERKLAERNQSWSVVRGQWSVVGRSVKRRAGPSRAVDLRLVGRAFGAIDGAPSFPASFDKITRQWVVCVRPLSTMGVCLILRSAKRCRLPAPRLSSIIEEEGSPLEIAGHDFIAICLRDIDAD
jgi:hypothetical protein